MKTAIRWIAVTLLVSVSALGCAARTMLEPAPEAVTLERGNDVVDHFSGVELIANPDAWRGIHEITQEVLPIKVIVRNRHGKPIRIDNRGFTLINDKGQRFAAKGPGEIEGSIQVASPAPYTGPTFYHHDFFSAPFGYYGGIHRGLDPFYRDPYYYSRFHYQTQISLPTEEMVSEALPELTLPDGGEVSGFIYFQEIDPSERVSLKMDLTDPEGNLFGAIVLPFVVR